MKANINTLETLAKMEDFRQKHQDDKQHPADWCMRCLEAIVAKSAGYESRNDWTKDLRDGKQYKDARDAQIADLEAEVQRLKSLLRKQCRAAEDMEACLANAMVRGKEGQINESV